MAGHAVTIDECRAFLEEKIFVLRPQDYGERYPKWPGLVGIEVESFALVASLFQKNKPVLPPANGEKNLKSILKEFVIQHEGCIVSDDEQAPVFSLPGKGRITFEPGGQFEFSSEPFPCLADACEVVEQFLESVDLLLSLHDLVVVSIGLNPWLSADEIGLRMQKPRYRAMNEYFACLSPFGKRMMRQTASIQVSLDFGSCEETLAKRYLAGQLLAPLMTCIFAYSSILEGKKAGYKNARAEAWQKLDPKRTGFVGLDAIGKHLTKASCVTSYLEFALSAPVVLIPALNNQVCQVSFRDWIHHGVSGLYPTLADWEYHLSLLFPEVRPRGFMELRSVDAQASCWQTVPASVYASLLYLDDNVDRVLDILPHSMDKNMMLWQRAAQSGYDDPEIASLCCQVMEWAVEGFSRLPPCFQGPGKQQVLEIFASHFATQKRSPADDLLDFLHNKEYFLPSDLRKLEERWQNLIK